MNAPELSIIVPVYQTKKYLNQCVDSILTQDFQKFELLLVDDGSTDGSEKICDEYVFQQHVIPVSIMPEETIFVL